MSKKLYRSAKLLADIVCVVGGIGFILFMLADLNKLLPAHFALYLHPTGFHKALGIAFLFCLPGLILQLFVSIYKIKTSELGWRKAFQEEKKAYLRVWLGKKTKK